MTGPTLQDTKGTVDVKPHKQINLLTYALPLYNPEPLCVCPLTLVTGCQALLCTTPKEKVAVEPPRKAAEVMRLAYVPQRHALEERQIGRQL